MDNSSKPYHYGPDFMGLLTLIFIVLKLIGKIRWSWWLVLAPMWGTFLVYALIGVAVTVWVHWITK